MSEPIALCLIQVWYEPEVYYRPSSLDPQTKEQNRPAVYFGGEEAGQQKSSQQST